MFGSSITWVGWFDFKLLDLFFYLCRTCNLSGQHCFYVVVVDFQVSTAPLPSDGRLNFNTINSPAPSLVGSRFARVV
ncbi:hypothetical protein A2U01_0043803, partial [Trifolium medium]|nr:hypothetical protein [Trifolium medium]